MSQYSEMQRYVNRRVVFDQGGWRVEALCIEARISWQKVQLLLEQRVGDRIYAQAWVEARRILQVLDA